jgi:hypothetical protein
MRERLIRALGGFPSIDSAIDAIRLEENGAKRRALLTYAVKRLYNTVGADDILKTDKTSGQWTYMGKPISKEETAVLVEQARSMLDTRLWKVLQSDIKYQANKRMFVDSADVHDLTAGKLLLFYTDIIHTRLKKLAGM